MTAFTAPTTASPGAGRRIGNVVRLHFANPMTTIWVPMIIIGAIFLVNLVIWWIVAQVAHGSDAADAREGFQWSGASFYVFVYMMVVAIQAMNATFALSQGLSATRRDFLLGSAAAFGLLTLLWTGILTVLGLIEQVSDGWGLGGRLFTTVLLGEDAGQRLVVTLCLFVFFFALGTAAGASFVRWKALGVTVFLLIIAVIVVGGAVLVTLAGAWPAVGEWFAANRSMGTALWLLLPAAVSGLAGWLLLRRATVR